MTFFFQNSLDINTLPMSVSTPRHHPLICCGVNPKRPWTSKKIKCPELSVGNLREDWIFSTNLRVLSYMFGNKQSATHHPLDEKNIGWWLQGLAEKGQIWGSLCHSQWLVEDNEVCQQLQWNPEDQVAEFPPKKCLGKTILSWVSASFKEKIEVSFREDLEDHPS